MRSKVAATVVAVLTCGMIAARSEAQTIAQGQAYGANVSLGPPPPIIDAGNTGPGIAPHAPPNPNSFDRSAAGATIPASPLIEVITGPSRTRGCVAAAGCPELFPPAAPADADLPSGFSNEVFVKSRAGDAVAAVLVGQAPGGVDVLQAATSNASITLRCNNDVDPPRGEIIPTSEVDLLVIAGNPVPLNQSPNTTVIVEGLPLVVMNEFECHTTPVGNPIATGVFCSVNALHARVLPDPPATGGLILDVILSHADAAVASPAGPCGVAFGACDAPLLTNSKKLAEVLNPDGSHKDSGIPSPGDKIRFTVQVVNSSSCKAGTNLSVIDRIPRGTTFDAASTTIQSCPIATPNCTAAADPIAGTVASCDPSLQFNGCEGEPPSDAARQCLTVNDGDLPVDTVKNIAFTVTVSGEGGCDPQGVGPSTCNTALIFTSESPAEGTQPGPVTIQCPTPCNPDAVPGATDACPPRATPTPTPTGGGGGTPTPTQTGGGGGGTRTPGAGGTPKPDFLVTTGSGGCALGGNSGGTTAEVLPVLIAGVWLGLRQRRKRRSRQ